MRPAWLISLLVVVLAGVMIANTVFIVDQRKLAVVAKYGEPVRLINPPGAPDPGLKLKIPFVETVAFFDERSQAVDARQVEVVTADNRRLLIDAVVQYRISDARMFFQALRNEMAARDRFGPLVAAGLRETASGVTAADVISQRSPALTTKALDATRARAARAGLGIEVLDLTIRRVDLPSADAETIFRRMTANLQQQAAQTRAQGDLSQRELMANADQEAATNLAEAEERASAIRGAGDAQAAQLYAAAYGQDPSFADFYRTMRAYENALARKDTTLVLSPDSDFFRYFRQGPKSR